MAPFEIGQRVQSDEFGPGIVRGTTAYGALIRVHFEATDTTEMVSAASLRLAASRSNGAQTGATTATPIPLTKVVKPVFALDERRLAVECLRQGLPPPGKLTSWTFGHEKPRAAVDAAIQGAAGGTGSVLLVRAAYGQGKSHLGRLGRELALEQGLATMHVELDGEGLSLRDGAGAVAALFASARLPKSATGDSEHLVPGLGTILRRAAPVASKGGIPKALEAFEPFLDRPSRWIESEPAVEVLESYLSGHVNAVGASEQLSSLLGESVAVPGLRMGYGTTAARQRSQAEQLGRVVHLAVIAGAKGAFIVIDELDHDVLNDWDGRVSDMLKELTRVARKNAIVLLLLTRENREDEQGLKFSDAQDLVLDQLREREVESLVHKTVDTYAGAFPSPALHNGRDDLLKRLREKFKREYLSSGWGPRYFVRATIEACEVARTQGKSSLADVAV